MIGSHQLRNASEVAWLKTIATMLPDNVPEVLHHDEEQGFFVMRFYDPTQYKNWKQELLAGAPISDLPNRWAGAWV